VNDDLSLHGLIGGKNLSPALDGIAFVKQSPSTTGIRGICADENYVYVIKDSAIQRYSVNNLEFVNSVATTVTGVVSSILMDSTHIFARQGSRTMRVAKSTLTVTHNVELAVGALRAIDSDSIYALNGNSVSRILKSNLTIAVTSSPVTGVLHDVVTCGDVPVVLRRTVDTTRLSTSKYTKSTMVKELNDSVLQCPAVVTLASAVSKGNTVLVVPQIHPISFLCNIDTLVHSKPTYNSNTCIGSTNSNFVVSTWENSNYSATYPSLYSTTDGRSLYMCSSIESIGGLVSSFATGDFIYFATSTNIYKFTDKLSAY